MAPLHISLAPSVTDAEDLYTLLGQVQVRAQVSVGYRLMGTVALLAAGFLLPGGAGMAAFCIAAVAGLATVAAIGDFVARSLLMDLVSLHDVIRPRTEPAELLAYQLAQLLATDPSGDQREAG